MAQQKQNTNAVTSVELSQKNQMPKQKHNTISTAVAVPHGYKMTKLGVIPKDWEVVRFEDVFGYLKTYSYSRSALSNEVKENSIFNIHYGDIHSKFSRNILDVSEYYESIPVIINPKEEYDFLKEGDLIIADASEDYEGICSCIEIKNLKDVKLTAGLHTFAVRSRENKVVNGYKSYLLKNNVVKNNLKKIATGISVYGVSKTNLNKVSLALPSLPEQKAIASILSTWDKAISTTTQLIQALQQRKKGLVQQLLSGKKRLAGFTENWEKGKLLDVCILVNGRAFKKTELLEEGRYKVLRVGNFFTNNKWYYSDLELDKDKYVDEGDLMYAWSASFGAKYWLGNKTIYHYHIWKVIPKRNILKEYLYYFFQFDTTRLLSLSQGGTMFHVTKGDMEKRKILFPPLKEQQAIANILTAADKEIKHYQAYLQSLQAQKKGLMQQLLTGKIRCH